MSKTLITLVALAVLAAPTTAFAQISDDEGEEAPAPKKPKKKKAALAEQPEEGDDEDEADDDAPAKPQKAKKAPPPPPAAEAEGEPAAEATEEGAKPKIYFAIERFAGFAYAGVSPDEGDASASLGNFNMGGTVLNPYAISRGAFDYRVAEQLWLGTSLGFSTFGVSAESGGESRNLGSAMLYTMTPRVGYQVELGRKLMFFPRAGLVLAGGSVEMGEGDGEFGIFSTGISLEGMLAIRITKTFNLLTGASLERTLSATATSSSGGSSDSTEIKGALTSFQLWLGLGGWK